MATVLAIDDSLLLCFYVHSISVDACCENARTMLSLDWRIGSKLMFLLVLCEERTT